MYWPPTVWWQCRASVFSPARSVFRASSLIAFISFWLQIDGLIGSHGILPIGNYLDAVHRTVSSAERFWQLPTLCWISSSDGFLHFLCAGGVVMSVLLIIGALFDRMAPVLWVLAILTNLTVIHRMIYTWQETKQLEDAQRGKGLNLRQRTSTLPK